jgi:hypothetical protein
MPTLYDTTVGIFLKDLRILSKILDRGIAHAKDTGNTATEETLLGARLIADMHGLAYQIQRISDTSKGLAVRVGGGAPVPMDDNEKTFPELQERIAKTIKVLESVKVGSFPSYSIPHYFGVLISGKEIGGTKAGRRLKMEKGAKMIIA